MAAAAIKEFAQFFRQFLDLCLAPDWPGDDTETEEIRKALEIASHVEMSVKKMKSEKKCYNEFLQLIGTNQNFSHIFLQNCLTDPPKSVLKKIINSDANLNLIDDAFRGFRNLYSEDRLVKSLSELMVEAASKKTLLKNMSTALPANKVQELKNQLFLFVILECDSNEIIADTFKDCCQQMMDALVLCLVKDNMVGFKKDDIELVRRKVITGFIDVMDCKDVSAKKFWQLLFNVDKENLQQMCLKYKTLCEMAFEALSDSYVHVIQNLPSEHYYIELTESQLYSKCSAIFECETLKFKFKEHMKRNGFHENCIPLLHS